MTLVLSQALNNFCGHCIRKYQVLCLSVVSERMGDLTRVYRPIYINISKYTRISMFKCICDEKYDGLRLNGVYVFVRC